MAKTIKRKRMYRTWYGETIKQIFEKFVRPALSKLLVHADERDLNEGMRRYFHTDTRSIYFARIKEAFDIPGTAWIDGHPGFKATGGRSYKSYPRTVVPGDDVVVRIDLTYNEVDIEFNENVFTMPLRAWAKIEGKVELIG